MHNEFLWYYSPSIWMTHSNGYTMHMHLLINTIDMWCRIENTHTHIMCMLNWNLTYIMQCLPNPMALWYWLESTHHGENTVSAVYSQRSRPFMPKRGKSGKKVTLVYSLCDLQSSFLMERLSNFFPKKKVNEVLAIPSRELTYPTLGKGKSSSKCHFLGIC